MQLGFCISNDRVYHFDKNLLILRRFFYALLKVKYSSRLTNACSKAFQQMRHFIVLQGIQFAPIGSVHNQQPNQGYIGVSG